MSRGLSEVIRDWLLEPVLDFFDEAKDRFDSIDRRLQRMGQSQNDQETELQTIVQQFKDGNLALSAAITEANSRVIAKIDSLAGANPLLKEEFDDLKSEIQAQTNAVQQIGQIAADAPPPTDPGSTPTA